MIECVKAGRLHVKTLLQKVQFVKCLKAKCTKQFGQTFIDKTHIVIQDKICTLFEREKQP